MQLRFSLSPKYDKTRVLELELLLKHSGHNQGQASNFLSKEIYLNLILRLY